MKWNSITGDGLCVDINLSLFWMRLQSKKADIGAVEPCGQSNAIIASLMSFNCFGVVMECQSFACQLSITNTWLALCSHDYVRALCANQTFRLVIC